MSRIGVHDVQLPKNHKEVKFKTKKSGVAQGMIDICQFYGANKGQAGGFGK